MGRKPLQPGEQGAITTTRVTKTPTGWLNDPQGDMWSARIRVGQAGKPAKEIRRIANTKKAAETACRTAADAETILAQAGASGTLEWQSVTNLWETYKTSPMFLDRIKASTRKVYTTLITISQADDPEWWAMPCIEAYQRANQEPLVANYAHNHGTHSAKVLKTILKSIAQYSSTEVAELAKVPITIPKGITSPKGRNHKDTNRTFTRTQLADLQKQLLERAPTKGSIVLLIMTYTGGRILDVASLKKTDIDWETGEIKMTSIKTSKPYPVKILPTTILNKVREYVDTVKGEWLFGDPSKTRNKSAFVIRMLARLGYPWASAHTVRKSVGSIIFDQYGLRAAAEWLAHSNVQITMQWYVKVDSAAPTFAPELDFNR